MIDPSAHLHYSEQHASDRNEENLLSVYKLEKVQTYSAISHNQVLMSEGKKKNHSFVCVFSHNADVYKPLTAPKTVNKLCE